MDLAQKSSGVWSHDHFHGSENYLTLIQVKNTFKRMVCSSTDFTKVNTEASAEEANQ